MNTFGRVLLPLFGVSQEQATDFGHSDGKAALRLETVVATVTKGCHMTLQSSNAETLVTRLHEVEPELRGYAYEGVGTGLAALDCLLPWKNRTKDFLDGAGAPYIYAVHIGAGLALARMRRQPEKFLARLDPVVGWITIDGYGFHQGFFARKRYVERQEVPGHLSAYARHTFDHGIGRSIWFVAGANVQQVAATIARFAEARHADLWSGVGLGCGYTGGVSRAAIETLQRAAGPHRSQLAVGAAIATHARKLAGSPAPYAELASQVLCGLPYEQAASAVEQSFQDIRNVVPEDGQPLYAHWRKFIETKLAV